MAHLRYSGLRPIQAIFIDIRRWNTVRQPNAVIGLVEGLPGQVHISCPYCKYHGITVTCAYFDGRALIRRKVHMMATSRDQPLSKNAA